MPASLYRLAGKPHHAEVSSVSPPPVEVKEAVQPAAETPAVEVAVPSEPANETIVESTVDAAPPETYHEEASADVVETPVADEVVEPTASVEEPATPSWDPTWTKAQLLEVALQLKLEVTSLNTKTQIIQALTAATSA